MTCVSSPPRHLLLSLSEFVVRRQYDGQVSIGPGPYTLTASCPGSAAGTTGTLVVPPGQGFGGYVPTAVCRFEGAAVRFTPTTTEFDVTAYVEREGLGGFGTNGFVPPPPSLDRGSDLITLYPVDPADGLVHTRKVIVGAPPSGQRRSAFFTCAGDQLRLDYRTPTVAPTAGQEIARLNADAGSGPIHRDVSALAAAQRSGNRYGQARALALVRARAADLPSAQGALVRQRVDRLRHLLGVGLPPVHVVRPGEHLWQVVRAELVRRGRPHSDHAVAVAARRVQADNACGLALIPGQLLVLPPGL